MLRLIWDVTVCLLHIQQDARVMCVYTLYLFHIKLSKMYLNIFSFIFSFIIMQSTLSVLPYIPSAESMVHIHVHGFIRI